jgi:hypothetical protein
MAIVGTGTQNQRIRWPKEAYTGPASLTAIIWAKSELNFTVPPDSSITEDLFGKWTPDTSTGTFTHQFSLYYSDASYVGKLVFLHDFSTTLGIWRSTNAVVSSNVLYQWAVTYVNTSTSNNPTFYFNGSSIPITEAVSPAGTALMDNSGDKISILDLLDSSVGVGTNISNKGPVYNVGVFNRILTSSEILSSYTAGQPGFYQWAEQNDNGLIFCPNLDMATDITRANFSGSTLSASNKIIDKVSCYEGVPAGDPTGL